GPDSFTYTIRDNLGATSNPGTVTITVGTAPPVAMDDQVSTPEDTPIDINVTANDTDSDGVVVPSTMMIVTQPVNGPLTLKSPGVVTYSPNANYNGPDSFTYTVNDDDGATSNVATVSITVVSVNDPPVAGDDSYTLLEDTPTALAVFNND